MLIRAVLISVLLHLVIFSSPPDRVRSWANAGPKSDVLKLTLVQQGVDASPSPGLRKVEGAKTVTQTPNRNSGVSPGAKSSPSNFGHFFQSTVGIDQNSGDKRQTRVPDASPGESVSISVAELGQYRLSLARSARQFKAYPPLARERGWEGVVHVSVAMPMGLGAPIVSLESSSGHTVLDRQALEMVDQAASLAILPETMRGKYLKISLPVEYRLAD